MERVLLISAVCVLLLSTCHAGVLQVGKEEEWGEGLKVLATHVPENCTHRARRDDVIHYHYIGKLASTGQVFGKSFDYDSPYIVGLGQGRIIAGMDRGLMDTCLWERRRITIPSHLGYGTRGVGEIIPANSTLVFYIRMIKIERNGAVLGAEENLEATWKQGLQSYTAKHWQEAIEKIERSLQLYSMYQNATKFCLRTCAETEVTLSKNGQLLVDKMASTDPLLRQFLIYSARAKCIRECKIERLPPTLRQPDPIILQRFNKRDPYAYLQYAHHKLGNNEEGLKCAYTYYFHNPNDTMATDSIKYYLSKLKHSHNYLVYREPGQLKHHAAYNRGVGAYHSERWLEAADSLESAVDLYLESMEKCRLSCEDIVFVNLTHPETTTARQEKLEREGFLPDSMEWHLLIQSMVRSLLECRSHCRDKMATVNGTYKSNYLSDHFNHLQFTYFKLGLLKKAAASAATFLVLEPSNTEMATNIKYYRTNGIAYEDSKAREDISKWQTTWENEDRLLQLALTGRPHKKQGLRGDDGSAHTHHEL